MFLDFAINFKKLATVAERNSQTWNFILVVLSKLKLFCWDWLPVFLLLQDDAILVRNWKAWYHFLNNFSTLRSRCWWRFKYYFVWWRERTVSGMFLLTTQKNASTQYMTYVRVMRLKKKILKHVSFFVQSTIKENISLW